MVWNSISTVFLLFILIAVTWIMTVQKQFETACQPGHCRACHWTDAHTLRPLAGHLQHRDIWISGAVSTLPPAVPLPPCSVHHQPCWGAVVWIGSWSILVQSQTAQDLPPAWWHTQTLYWIHNILTAHPLPYPRIGLSRRPLFQNSLYSQVSSDPSEEQTFTTTQPHWLLVLIVTSCHVTVDITCLKDQLIQSMRTGSHCIITITADHSVLLQWLLVYIMKGSHRNLKMQMNLWFESNEVKNFITWLKNSCVVFSNSISDIHHQVHHNYEMTILGVANLLYLNSYLTFCVEISREKQILNSS